ncbi:MAG: Sensor histidine kinase RcsC [Phycisphaerales bacterium]|nr:Sensor histidine kinase RcsC [Phycisphaerales bacterium]
MTDSGGFGGISLLELFKLEAESHCAALSSGLLALEKQPADVAIIEPLMRAAHSIKGAARIVGLDSIVTLAHAMEECFLAAKSGKEALAASRIDRLLKGVDVLSELRSLSDDQLATWSQANAPRLAALAAELRAPAPPTVPPAGQASSPPVAASSANQSDPAAPPTPVNDRSPEPIDAPSAGQTGQTSAASASHVRVSAQTLNRILFLAGESTVQAARLQSLRSLLGAARSRERTLETSLQAVHDLVSGSAGHGPTAAASADTAAALAALSNAADGIQTSSLEQAARFEEAFRGIEELSSALYTEVLRSRMRPFAEGVTAYPRMVRDISRQLGKDVDLRITGETVEVDRDILQKLESPLTHMIRNSLDHGIESPAERLAARKPPRGTITLAARHHSGMLVIEVKDDGRGIDPEAIRRKVVEKSLVDPATAHRLTRAELMEFPFLPGFSTRHAATELSGRGVGLDIVRSMVAEVAGTVTLDTEAGRGARFTLRLPVTRSVIRAAVVRVGEFLLAVPLARLDRVLSLAAEEVHTVQGRMQCNLEGSSLGLVHAAEMFASAAKAQRPPSYTVLVIPVGQSDACGIIVDQVFGEEDLVVRPLDARLGAVPHIAAAALRADGSPVFVVDVDDLARSLKRAVNEGAVVGLAAPKSRDADHARRRILVVDDSITVREVERQLLLRRGYAVEVAVDGKEGFNALRAGSYDLLITDVDMPRMTGIELVRAVRKEPRLAEIPIIIVSYKDREEDRRLGLEAGATAYLTKGSFHDESLIRMVEDLIGAPL